MDLSEQTIEQLENEQWADISNQEQSGLIRTCHMLRKKPLKDFSTEEIRVMIAQDIGRQFLLPMAITQLQKNILAEGRYYAGDLLNTVLQVDESYWYTHPDQFQQVLELFNQQQQRLKSADCSWEIKTNWFARFKIFSAFME